MWNIVAAPSLLRWNSTGSCVAGIAAGTSGVGVNYLYYPYDLTLDSNNSLYITDSWNNRIQKYILGVTAGVTVAGQANGTLGASSLALHMPVGIVLDSNRNLYFTDRSNHRLMYWANGASSGTTIAGTTGKRDKQRYNNWVFEWICHSCHSLSEAMVCVGCELFCSEGEQLVIEF